MGRNHLCEQAIPKDPAHLLPKPCGLGRPSGLSFGFPKLSPSRRQLDYVLLARPPRYSPCGFHVRLACLIHAANVRSEPGSNPSRVYLIPQPRDSFRFGFPTVRTHSKSLLLSQPPSQAIATTRAGGEFAIEQHNPPLRKALHYSLVKDRMG